MTKTTNLILTTTIAVILLAVPITSTGIFAQSVEPNTVNVEIEAGGSTTVPKTVTTGELPANPDIYMLADTTGSMGSIITQVKADMMTIQTDVKAMEPTAQFGVGEYKDFPLDAFAYQHLQAITANDVAVDNAANTLVAFGGFDGSEGQFFALSEIANNPGTISWRTDSTRIVVWFGDAPGHDPICSAISGLGSDITEATVIADLQAAGITVIAISTVTGFFSGLNDNPTISAGDYSGTCSIGGSAGQADRITAATGGSHASGVSAGTITQTIIDSLEALQTDVVPDASDCTDFDVTFDPSLHTLVDPLTSVDFDEIIAVPDGTAPGDYHCTVDFTSGVDGGIIGSQEIWVTVPDPIIEVEIDIKPDSDPSSVICKANKKGDINGLVPVAIFGADDFDVSTINLDTLQLNGVDVTVEHDEIHTEDLNGDGFDDMVLHLDKAGVCEATSDENEYPLKDSADAILTGLTTDDPPKEFEGTGDIRIVKR